MRINVSYSPAVYNASIKRRINVSYLPAVYNVSIKRSINVLFTTRSIQRVHQEAH